MDIISNGMQNVLECTERMKEEKRDAQDNMLE